MPFCKGRLKLNDFSPFLKEFYFVADAERSKVGEERSDPRRGLRNKVQKLNEEGKK